MFRIHKKAVKKCWERDKVVKTVPDTQKSRCRARESRRKMFQKSNMHRLRQEVYAKKPPKMCQPYESCHKFSRYTQNPPKICRAHDNHQKSFNYTKKPSKSVGYVTKSSKMFQIHKRATKRCWACDTQSTNLCQIKKSFQKDSGT